MKIITVKDWIFTEYFFVELKWYFLRNRRNGCFNSMGATCSSSFPFRVHKTIGMSFYFCWTHETLHQTPKTAWIFHWFGEFSNVIYWPKMKEQKAINVFAAEYQFSFLQRQRHHTSANCHDKSQTTSFFCIFAQLAAVTERQKQGLLQYQKWSRRWKVLCLISPHLTF